MDQYTVEKRAKNPKETANIFQRVIFLFTIPIFRKGLKKDLDENDIYDIIPEYRAETLGAVLEKTWNEERQISQPKLLNSLWKIFGCRFLALGIFNALTKTFLIVLQPILIGEIVSYCKPNQTAISEKDVWCYILAFAVCTFSYAITIHSYMFGIEQLSLKVQLAVCNLIYRKCLSLNTSSTSEVAAGQAVTLITKDISTFYFSIHFTQQLLVGGIQTLLMTYIMYREIEGAAFAGILLLILFIPIQVYIGKFTSKYRLKTAGQTDQRIKITQEILNAIRIIKMYTWEIFFFKKVSMLRKSEIGNLRNLFYIKAIAVCIGHLISRFSFYVSVVTYIALGTQITAEKAFITISCFTVLRPVLTTFIPLGITQIAELKASLLRITNFLLLEEVKNQTNVVLNGPNTGNIYLSNVSVKIGKGLPILNKISFSTTKGATLITGPTGAGKSILLKVLLGDYPHSTGNIEVCGNISYASQEPWLFPATIRQNIIFGEQFEEDRYGKVLEICALHKDISIFPKGDVTLITDKGLNLSKGQQARINLARAIYKRADIYLLDDCLSSVDSHVGNHIFSKCIKQFLKDSTCVLVTHNSNFFTHADNIIILDKGCLTYSGNYENLKKFNDMNLEIFTDVSDVLSFDDCEQIDLDEGENESCTLLKKPTEDSPNVYKEKREKGSVDKKIYFTYLTSGGGVPMLVLLIILFTAAQATASWSDYFVSFWVNGEQELRDLRSKNMTNSIEYEKLKNFNDNITTFYSIAIVVTIALTVIRSFVFFAFISKASMEIHNLVMTKILDSQMIFFDNNLSGTIINRFSRDLQIVDEFVPNVLFEFLRVFLTVLGILVVVSSVNAYFIIPSVLLTVVLEFTRRLYMKTGRSLKRLEGSTRSPMIGYLNATLEGLTTIRASQAQRILRKEFENHQDLHNSTVHMNLATSRAFGFLTDLISGFYIIIITILFLILKSSSIAGNVGLAITQAFTLTGLLQWGIRELAELQNKMISTERILEYQNISAENKCGRVFTSWPDTGRIVFKNISLSYTSHQEKVLNNINFEIEPKQKIGIIGRTGAGKTSIISTLFRMYHYDGSIFIDGVDIKTLSMNYLRSKISIIPQDPVLFSGTLRNNLDPYVHYSDNVLWDALDQVEMKRLIKSLDVEIHEGGSEFSVGQKQLLCLARAIIQKNNILVLDEATANVDSQTDSLIQNIIKQRFNDCTVVTIAHKLQTILDADKVMVLDSGAIIQFNSPKVLMDDKDGLFYNMVKESGLL